MVNRLIQTLVLMTFCAVCAQATELKDPMRPDVYRPAPEAVESVPPRIDTTSWRLTAVLLSAQRRVAVINGRSFQPGDTLEGFKVTRISGDRVELRNPRRTVVLRRVGTGLKVLRSNPVQK